MLDSIRNFTGNADLSATGPTPRRLVLREALRSHDTPVVSSSNQAAFSSKLYIPFPPSSSLYAGSSPPTHRPRPKPTPPSDIDRRGALDSRFAHSL